MSRFSWKRSSRFLLLWKSSNLTICSSYWSSMSFTNNSIFHFLNTAIIAWHYSFSQSLSFYAWNFRWFLRHRTITSLRIVSNKVRMLCKSISVLWKKFDSVFAFVVIVFPSLCVIVALCLLQPFEQFLKLMDLLYSHKWHWSTFQLTSINLMNKRLVLSQVKMPLDSSLILSYQSSTFFSTRSCSLSKFLKISQTQWIPF